MPQFLLILINAFGDIIRTDLAGAGSMGSVFFWISVFVVFMIALNISDAIL